MPRQPSKPDPEKQLMIKTKTCQRLIKEVAYYKQEVIENEQKLEEMKNDTTKDSYDIKRFEQVLGESYMMVPDSTKRLQQAYDDLTEFLTTQEGLLNESGEWYSQAKEILNNNATDSTNNTNDNPTPIEQPQTNVDDLVEGEAF